MDNAEKEPAPKFEPRLFFEHGVEYYDDNRILGSVGRSVVDGVNHLAIYEWRSDFKNRGCSVTALEWLRAQGFEVITADQVGLITEDGGPAIGPDGVPDDRLQYWLHMHERGLVDVLLDDYGVDITPARSAIPKARP